MEDVEKKETGWKPIPLPLKILFVLFIIWMVGAVMNLPNLYQNGMPLLGTFVFGMNAALFPLLVDFIGPMTFLLALWTRQWWAAYWAFFYNGIFILNNMVALFTVREELGLPQILIPTIASLIFVTVIYWKRRYFKQADLRTNNLRL
jgi:hypothetical protein